ncbi:MAG: PQQ-binding-like beta-propeller repeat protein [Oscillospiraceae bacterium]|nr:PQQ-binding-like beta-propeller repeat protein [Oscillospiraceae bacterium]
MKMRYGKKAISFVLALIMLACVIPASVLAAPESSFVLVAESDGKLVIAPEYVTYAEGANIGEALMNSSHSFEGIEDGQVYAIDGAAGNYTRSDQNGSYDLATPAQDVTHYRFSEDTGSSQPSEGLVLLMTAMADYLLEPADVQAAAKSAYDAAYNNFVGITSDSAKVLAKDLTDAVSAYKAGQDGEKFAVSFSDGTDLYTAERYEGISITVNNAYGKSWTDDGDGVVELTADNYDFAIVHNGLHIEGSFALTENATVTAALPAENWLLTDSFRLSGSYGAESDDDTVSHFSDDEFKVGTWNGRYVTAVVPDTFTGTVYTNTQYNSELLSEVPEIVALYTTTAGEKKEFTCTFDSLTTGPVNVLSRGANGNTVIYRVSSEGSDGYTYSQDYTVVLERKPSLKSVTVVDQRGVDQAATIAFDSKVTAYDYKVLDTVTEVTVSAEGLEDSYDIKVNGEDIGSGVTVAVAENTTIEVSVSANGYETVYTLNILKGEGKGLSFITASADVEIHVENSNGVVMPYEKFKEGTSGNRYQYTLVPGEVYSYVATAGEYYHVKDEFTLEEVANSTIKVDVSREDWLTEMALGTGQQANKKGSIAMDSEFASGDHSYNVVMEDTESKIYLWVNAGADYTVEAIYTQIHGSSLYHNVEKTIALTAGSKTGKQLTRVLLAENPYGNTVTIRLSKQDGGMTYYQDYELVVERRLSLKNLTAQCGGSVAVLMHEDGTDGYVPSVRKYEITVPMAADSLTLYPVSYIREASGGSYNTCYGDAETGYRAKVDGVDVTEAGEAVIELDGTINTQTVTIEVTNDNVPNLSETYIIDILKSPPVEVTFNFSPEDAILSLTEVVSDSRVWKNDGTYMICEGFTYSYTLTKYGYVGQRGTIEVTRNAENALVLILDGTEYAVEEKGQGGAVTIDWALEKAAENSSIDTTIKSEWSDFRGGHNNNAVTDAPIPISAEEGTLYWANQLGEGYDSNAVGSPIIVDGDIITYAGNMIYRVDAVSGEVLATGEMDHKSSFAITPPVYYEGMVFVALSNGAVQAFNAATLESLWVYTDALGGQPNCPLTVKNGYLYTGFWNQETQKANFICISVTDEDPTQEKEAKCETWYYSQVGGFYWAGAYVSDDFVIVGTDDGKAGYSSQTSQLLMIEPLTGKLLDSWTGLDADIRCTVVYDEVTDAYYFTSKGGTFYCVQVENLKFVNKWTVELTNGKGGTPMSTSSPSVYNGRAYIGVSGVGQFSAYSGHNITVIDLNKRAIAYQVETHGYPQTSGLLTTAYEDESGYVYVYFFDNMTPGKLRVIRDKAGQTAPDYVTTEGSYTTAYALFTPTGDQAEYAICSPIVDEYGTVYFKNDSAHLMAFGSAIEKIEVTALPDKTTYMPGEKFDPAGMVVTATYTNGKTRDITNYVTYSTEALTAEDAEFTVTFEYVLYHNQEDGTSMKAGVVSTTPYTTIDLVITDGTLTLGDVNGDGDVNREDAQLILDYEAQVRTSLPVKAAADVSGDGNIDSNDAVLILQFADGKFDKFPAEA